ncbi:unnamed protein product [Vicia faba]|uniref:UspA domain-containing protein n=1 Tax=Vicia faba TaxID=3906 RepID=A0AAV1AEV8_VICFA|nr:unnamed protein product [Vicia faba]
MHNPHNPTFHESDPQLPLIRIHHPLLPSPPVRRHTHSHRRRPSPTNVLFGADWGSIDLTINTDPNSEEENLNNVNETPTPKRKLEEDYDAFTATKSADLAKPLREAQIPYKIHIVKDHDMKERLCLEVERLGLSAVIMGSRGFGAARRGSDGKLGSRVMRVRLLSSLFLLRMNIRKKISRSQLITSTLSPQVVLLSMFLVVNSGKIMA